MVVSTVLYDSQPFILTRALLFTHKTAPETIAIQLRGVSNRLSMTSIKIPQVPGNNIHVWVVQATFSKHIIEENCWDILEENCWV